MDDFQLAMFIVGIYAGMFVGLAIFWFVLAPLMLG